MVKPGYSSESESSVGSDWDIIVTGPESVDGNRESACCNPAMQSDKSPSLISSSLAVAEDGRPSVSRSLSLYSDGDSELDFDLSDDDEDDESFEFPRLEKGTSAAPSPPELLSHLPPLSLTESQFLEGALDTPCAGPAEGSLTSIAPRAIPRPVSSAGAPKPRPPPPLTNEPPKKKTRQQKTAKRKKQSVTATKPARPPRVVTPRPLLCPPDLFDQPQRSCAQETDVTKKRPKSVSRLFCLHSITRSESPDSFLSLSLSGSCHGFPPPLLRRRLSFSSFVRLFLCQPPEENVTQEQEHAEPRRFSTAPRLLPPVPSAIPPGSLTPIQEAE